MAETRTINVAAPTVGTLSITGVIENDEMDPTTITGGTYTDLHETTHELTGEKARKIIEEAESEEDALAIVHDD